MKGEGQKRERAFKAISLGRAVELAEQLVLDLGDDQIDALIELLSGITDELGEGGRHTAAIAAIRHASAMRNDDWLKLVGELQQARITGSRLPQA